MVPPRESSQTSTATVFTGLSIKALAFILLGAGLFSACSSIRTRSQRSVSAQSGSSVVTSESVDFNSSAPQYHQAVQFDWPVDRARLTQGFKAGKRRRHLGIDLAGPRGTPVLSAHSGMVIYAGRDFRGFGKMILIENGRGWATLYAHLDKFLVSEGQKIRIGETIGLLGNTGRTTGPHLHFEIRKEKLPVDPLMYLPGGMEASRRIASSQ